MEFSILTQLFGSFLFRGNFIFFSYLNAFYFDIPLSILISSGYFSVDIDFNADITA